jgi:hypothetical protein
MSALTFMGVFFLVAVIAVITESPTILVLGFIVIAVMMILGGIK